MHSPDHQVAVVKHSYSDDCPRELSCFFFLLFFCVLSDASLLKNSAQVLYREDHVPQGEHNGGAVFPERQILGVQCKCRNRELTF